MKKATLTGLFVIALLGIVGTGCKKDSDDSGSGTSEQGSMDVRMTDGAGLYDEVNIDIQGVKANIQGHGWVDITPTRRGVYNILELNNGIDTLIASSNAPTGDVTEVRLILGPNNSVVVAGTSFPLSTPSAQESGLKLKFRQAITAGAKCTIWIDFDAHKSIVITGNGTYKLKPVLRCFVHNTTGSIIGDVNPDNAAYFAYAVRANDVEDTCRTFLRGDGTFKLWGLSQGLYTVGFETKERVTVKTLPNISVTAKQETNMGIVNIP